MTNDTLLKPLRRVFFYTFAGLEKLYYMDIFLSASIIFTSLSLVACLYFRHIKDKKDVDLRVKMAALIFICEAVLVVCDMSAGGEIVRRLPLDMTVCITGLSTVTSSIWDEEWIKRISDVVIALLLTLTLYFILAAFDLLGMISRHWMLRTVMICSLVLVLLHCLAIWWRIRDVRAVMRAGTVWQCLSLSVDCIYVMMVTTDVVLYVFLDGMFPDAEWHSFVISSILALVTFAFGVRIINDSLFVMLFRHERRIVESMKISHVEVANDAVKEDGHYRDIYERVMAYFDEYLPYLNSELTISDVVKVVFTNKLYISRAISKYTGRNFCQFVNYYRVTYSVNLFRKNPDLKILELANASGFNTVASFSMAFKLFMNENPSDWCRKERMKLIKGRNKLWNP